MTRPHADTNPTRRMVGATMCVIVLVVAATACRPSRYDVATVVGNLQSPWDIAFAPDGSMLFTERVGDVGVFRNGAAQRFARPADVVATGEGGMMGLAVDPSFQANRRIYTCFMSNAAGAIDIRVVRWEVSADWTTLTARADILTGIPVNTAGSLGRHAGCRIRFGPDYALWVTTGDAAMGGNPQDGSSLAGKVLRITYTGAPAPGNPGGALRPEIYAYGFRNPQGISWRTSDNLPFIVEHGPNCDDEITALRAGGNGGWDPVVPGNPNGYDESVSMTDTQRFPGALRPAWSSGCPTIAPSGGTFVSGSDWGALRGQLVVAVLKDHRLQIHDMSDGAPNHDGVVILSDQGRLRTAVEGPDGNLYVAVDSNPGQIFRVDPVL